MPGILGMTHLYKHNEVCVSVCLLMDALMDCALPGPFSATSPVPPIRIPKTPRKPRHLQSLHYKMIFHVTPSSLYSLTSLQSQINKEKKMYFPTAIPMGCWELPWFGRAELPTSGWFCRCWRTCRWLWAWVQCKCWDLLLGGKYLDKICWY